MYARAAFVKGVAANENIDASLVQLFASQKIVNFSTGRSDSLARPVRDFRSPQALGVAAR